MFKKCLTFILDYNTFYLTDVGVVVTPNNANTLYVFCFCTLPHRLGRFFTMSTNKAAAKSALSNASWFILGPLVIILLVTSIIFAQKVSQLQQATNDLNYIEYLNSTTQRFLKLTLEQRDTEKLIFYLDDIVNNSFGANAQASMAMSQSTVLTLATNILTDWENIKIIISRPTINYDDLYFAGERHFFHATDLSLEANEYIQSLSDTISMTQIILLTNIILIAAIIAVNMVKTQIELKLSLELARTSFLDESTGLFNRSKCQELFKTDTTREDEESAIIVFDLNDLKKANDVHGHRVGDELIASFAKVLKDASRIHITEPFIGRYGGDEFIVFYSNSNEEEVLLYLKEIKYLAESFNRTSTKFQISYAAGYALALNKGTKVTIRQLFDKADEAMYANKKAIKAERGDGEDLR